MKPASSDCLISALPPFSSLWGRRWLWQRCSPVFTWRVRLPHPLWWLGAGGRAGGCNTSFSWLVFGCLSYAGAYEGRTCVNTLSRGLLQFFLVTASSQSDGQVLRECHIWLKGAGGKKHLPPTGLRPPSAREGGRRILPLQHGKGRGVLK